MNETIIFLNHRSKMDMMHKLDYKDLLKENSTTIGTEDSSNSIYSDDREHPIDIYPIDPGDPIQDTN